MIITKKKIARGLSAFVFTVGLVYSLLSLQGHSEIKGTISGFYDMFIEKDYINCYKYFEVKFREGLTVEEKSAAIVQRFIDDRHWYGTIKDASIKWIFWTGRDEKTVLAKVRYSHGEDVWKQSTDKFKMKKVNNEWIIDQYISGSPWPTLP